MSILVYRNSTGVPIFEIPPPKYSAHQIVRILLDQNIDERITLKRPIDAPSSSTFVVDISKLANPDDIKRTSMASGYILVYIPMSSSALTMKMIVSTSKKLLMLQVEITCTYLEATA